MKGKDRAFWHELEQLIVGQVNEGSEFDGMFEVVDSEGFRIAIAFTLNLAVRNAIEEMEYITWNIDAFLGELFGESS
jgi:hypothetical protein